MRVKRRKKSTPAGRSKSKWSDEKKLVDLAEQSRGIAMAATPAALVEARRIIGKVDLEELHPRDRKWNVSIPKIIAIAHAAKKKGSVGRPPDEEWNEKWIEKLAQQIQIGRAH